MDTDPAPGSVARVLAVADPTAQIERWTLEAEPYPARTPTTERLARVVADAADGRQVRVFAKTIRSLRHWPMIELLPTPVRELTVAHFPWRVEADAYAAGILEGLAAGLRPPAVYEVEDLGDDRIRIWMEDVPASPVAWGEERYRRAARVLGRLAGRTRWDRLPAAWPRLFPGPGFIYEGRTAVLDLPALRSEHTWRHPDMQALTWADPALRHDLLVLADRAPGILAALDGLPRSLAHGDACPQNLLADPLADDGFVAVDWGFVGLAPIGYDLGQLLAGRVESGDLAVDGLPALRELILDAYLDSLRDEGVSVDAAEVRLGFIGGLLLRSGFTAIPLDGLAGRNDGDGAAELRRRARYARFLLDQQDQLAGSIQPDTPFDGGRSPAR